MLNLIYTIYKSKSLRNDIRLAYVINNNICYFSGLEQGTTSTINGAEIVIETIAKKEKVSFSKFRYIDIQTNKGYNRIHRGEYKAEEIKYEVRFNKPAAIGWTPVDLPQNIFNLFKEFIGINDELIHKNIKVPEYVQASASQNIAAAAAAGDNEMIQKFLDQGVSVNWKEGDGITAMHAAVLYGHLHTVLFLLENGADINIVSNYNKTPYDVACNSCDQCTMRNCGYTDEDIEKLKQTLIEKGADTDTHGRLEYYHEHIEEFPETSW